MNDSQAIIYGTITGILLALLWIFFLTFFDINILWFLIPEV